MLGMLALGVALGQDLGHKLPGTVGMDAGRAAEPGLYVADRALYYGAREYRDRHGERIAPEDFRLDAFANALGVSGTVQLDFLQTRVSASAGVPVAAVRARASGVEASVDRFGLTDLFLQPLRLSWRQERFDAVVGYALYVPTGLSPLAGGQGLSSGHVTQQVAAGGTAYVGEALFTALASYDNHNRKRGVDLTRGDTFQVEVGLGARVGKGAEIGVAGAALWQVTGDSGSDLPEPLAGARDRVYAVGPEIAVPIPAIRAALRARYERDLGVRSRPDGHLVVVGIVFVALRPDPADAP